MKCVFRKQHSGFALPMTIIAVAGLALLLIGLMTVLTLERKTARSYSDSTRADLAVESGLANALGLLSEVAVRDDALVFRLEDTLQPQVASSERPLGFREQFFTYGAVFENGAWRGIPLFSGATETSLGSGQINTQTLSSSLASYVSEAVPLGRTSEHDQNIPRAKWVEIPSSDPKGYTMRYAFWIEDLSGRIDGKSVGLQPRNLGLNSAELDITTILDPTKDSGKLPPPLDAKRDKIFTSATVRQLLTTDEAKRIEPYISYLPPSKGLRPAIIPQGFGYADAGKPAPDLNTFVKASDVKGIADHIERNLPLFKNRKGGFPASEDYVKTIAASIIDYADKDSNATTGTGYRGIDSYPFVNEMYDRYQITTQTDEVTKISVETYIELWNPCQQAINGEVEFTNINAMKFKLPPSGDKQLTPFTFPPQNISLPANGFRVLYLGEKKYSFVNEIGRPAQLNFYASQQQNFELRWNGVLVDRARKGVERPKGYLEPAPRPNGDDQYTYNWKGNASPTHDLNLSQAGDPRASYYVDYRIRNHSYDKSNWGGRAEKRISNPIDYIPDTYEVLMSDWPDRGSSSISGTKPRNDKIRPIAKAGGSPQALEDGTPYPRNQPEMAPAFISNYGSYKTLAELGNIFDPAQWKKIEDKKAFTPVNSAGGGLSLAIGRPEFPPFDKDGLRAAQLLDIFTAATLPASPPSPPININTAPREVLRSFFGGLTLSDDPANPGIRPPKENQCGDLFADNVIARRSKFPLRGFSDLNMIGKESFGGTDEVRFFGNPTAYSAGKMPDKKWDDAGHEELFRKIVGLVSFQSKNFRIVVAGESLDNSGRVVGRSAREYHYCVEPQRNADGTSLALPDKPVIITKSYERTF